jgi:hypothetical protein
MRKDELVPQIYKVLTTFPLDKTGDQESCGVKWIQSQVTTFLQIPQRFISTKF